MQVIREAIRAQLKLSNYNHIFLVACIQLILLIRAVVVVICDTAVETPSCFFFLGRSLSVLLNNKYDKAVFKNPINHKS